MTRRSTRRRSAHLDETLRRQLLDGDWQVAEGLAFSYRDDLHSVPAFAIPREWDRFESFDHGTTNPACRLAYAVDYQGNVVVFDSYYSPGLPSKHAHAFREKRAAWWPKDNQGWPIQSPTCWADPEMWAVKGETKLGDPASDITEYQELGIDGFVKANNRRRAGRMRIAELLTPHPDRYFPSWHPGTGGTAAVRDRCSLPRARGAAEVGAAAADRRWPQGRRGDRRPGLGIKIPAIR